MMRLVKAKLVKQATNDGLVEITAPLGKVYTVDLDDINIMNGFNLEKRVKHKKQMIATYVDGMYTGEMPVEVLEFEGDS